MGIACLQCGAAYPEHGLPHCCPSCQGLFDQELQAFDPARVETDQPGMWRYRHTFGLDARVEPVTLGEGNTPLVWSQVAGRRVAFKCEFLNPSGSFKDRGSSLIATWLRQRGIHQAVEDSSGNAGASLAAYAARAGIQVRIFIPQAAGGPKRRQIEAFGAELVPVPGSRTQVSQAVGREVDGGQVYASHAYLPFNLPGYATAAYEIHAQLGGRLPGTVIAPAGQGGLLLGLGRGFQALRVAMNADRLPKLIGVQARACAPLWAGFNGSPEPSALADEATLAEGIRVRFPVRAQAVLAMVRESEGEFAAVEESAILPGRAAYARMGLYVEPTSAITWAVLQAGNELPEPIVVVLTGSGFKYEPSH